MYIRYNNNIYMYQHNIYKLVRGKICYDKPFKEVKQWLFVSWRTDSVIDFHNDHAVFFSIVMFWVDTNSSVNLMTFDYDNYTFQ